MSNQILFFSIFAYLTTLILGFLVGRITAPKQQQITYVEQKSANEMPEKFSQIKQSNERKNVVSIDESRFVTNVSTESLTQKNGEVGTKMTVNDDVGSSVSKLAQLKRNR